MSPKCNDQGMFSISCKIGKVGIKRAMRDLEASIYVLPFSLYFALKVGPLKEIGAVILLYDRSVVYPKGVLKEVLV